MVYDDNNKLKLLHDNPLKFETNKDKYDNDGLNFNIYSDVVSQAIIDTPTPFTVGIYGKWGKGKTSFLNMLKVRVDDKKWETNHTSVWFNAWQYEKEKHLIVPLIATITKALRNDKGVIKSGYEDIVSTLHDIASSIKINISYKLPSVFGVEADIKASNDKKISAKLLEESIYYDAFNKLEELSNKLSKKYKDEKKIIVFIDDLDRCFPPNAVRLLENIKLVLSQKGFVFVVGVAKEVIEKYLKKRYKEDYGIDEGNHDKSYLEKIIQLSFNLPKFNTKTKELVDSLYKKVNENHESEISVVISLLDSIIENSNISPRFLVRVINQSKIHSRIYEKLNEKKTDKIENIFDLYMFTLVFENLYEIEYEILSKCTDNQLKVFIKEIDKESEKKIEIDPKIKNIKEKSEKDESLRKLLANDIAQTWLSDFNKRQVTSEFIDSESGKSEEDINEEKEEIKKNFRNEILDLEIKLKDEESFKKEMKVQEKSYKTFVEVINQNEKKFEFSKFLVTNIWFKKFINDEGYSKKEHWSKKGWEFIKSNDIDKPEYIDDERFNHNFKPVVGVSFYEAEAFCKWLTQKSEKSNDLIKYEYSLPSEKQFEYVALKERATQVEKDRNNNEYKLFPWGTEFKQNYCNNSNLGLGSTSVVGIFSDGDSPFGISDMSGNVWKWTDSESKDFEGAKVLKGGSWNYIDEDNFSASGSINGRPDTRNVNVGFFLTRTKK